MEVVPQDGAQTSVEEFEKQQRFTTFAYIAYTFNQRQFSVCIRRRNLAFRFVLFLIVICSFTGLKTQPKLSASASSTVSVFMFPALLRVKPRVPVCTARPTMLRSVFRALAGSARDAQQADAQPANAENSSEHKEDYDEIVEGSARIRHPKGDTFYNPTQIVNRDLSVLVLRHHARNSSTPLRILEALSATGLRSIRYFKEVPKVASVVANDLDPTAVATIRNTVRLNGLDPDAQVLPNHGDAAVVMALAVNDGNLFDVIDLDPYGSAAPFIEPAVRCAKDGALLCVTCTDLVVLCGNHPEICYGRYAATPLKGPTTHEMAVRIVFGAIQLAANRIGRAIEPVLCAKIDFYVRLFVRIRDVKSMAQRTPSNMSLVFQCNECQTQRFQPMGRLRDVPTAEKNGRKRKGLRTSPSQGSSASKSVCAVEPNGAEGNGAQASTDKIPEKRKTRVKYSSPMVTHDVSSRCATCNGNVTLGGPIWSGPLIGEGVADSLNTDLKNIGPTLGSKSRDRVAAIIRLVDEEVRNVPLFHDMPNMCKVLKVSPPPSASIRAALVSKGYEVSQSHTSSTATKTTAPVELLWDMLRLWAKEAGSSVLKNMVNAGDDDSRRSAGEQILSKEVHLIQPGDIDFTVKKDKFVRRGGSEKQGVRFPPNPEPNWGPKARAGKRARFEQD